MTQKRHTASLLTRRRVTTPVAVAAIVGLSLAVMLGMAGAPERPREAAHPAAFAVVVDAGPLVRLTISLFLPQIHTDTQAPGSFTARSGVALQLILLPGQATTESTTLVQ